MYAIQANDISKVYRLYNKPVDRLKELVFRRPFHKEFVALRDISLLVAAGESVGIIGENGAGKSTLLKILAGTLAPTSGEYVFRGKVAALLELGAGFHPDFTGRQNIYLNASLLGLSEAEIKEKEEEIIRFSELEKFIDQPVKTYSSGMYVRLAFSIATSIDPDILIIDEALSVGDQRFQKKCIDRMMSFKDRGKTILFCSHSLYHVNHLCQKALWIHNGSLRMSGKAFDVTQAYEDWCREQENSLNNDASHPQTKSIVETGGSEVNVKVRLKNSDNSHRPALLHTGDDIIFQISCLTNGYPYHLAAGIARNDETIIFGTSTQIEGQPPFNKDAQVEFAIPALPLLAGSYRFEAMALDDTGNVVLGRNSIEFRVVKENEFIGIMALNHHWKIF